MKTIWLSLFLIVFTHQVCAYDFKDNGIFYNVFSYGIDEETGEMNGFLEVTFDEEVQGVYPIVSYYAGDVVIPDTACYQGYKYPVKRIGAYAFSSCFELTSVSLPQTITEIGEGAFNGCESLTYAHIPNSVTTIGDSAFDHCTSLTSVTLSDSVTSIGNKAFANCTSLTSVNIPDSVTTIGDGAFKGCSHVTIYGHFFSYAKKYAKEQQIRFRTVL